MSYAQQSRSPEHRRVGQDNCSGVFPSRRSPRLQLLFRIQRQLDHALEQLIGESIHFLGALRGESCVLAGAEFRIPSLKRSAELVIQDLHPHLQ